MTSQFWSHGRAACDTAARTPDAGRCLTPREPPASMLVDLAESDILASPNRSLPIGLSDPRTIKRGDYDVTTPGKFATSYGLLPFGRRDPVRKLRGRHFRR